MRRRYVVSLLVIVVVGIGALAATLLTGTNPQLGLDLQGGASVTLKPTTDVDSGRLDQAIGVIRNRVDALGVAEPDISRQGDSIVVQLPGVEDQRRALAIVGQTAELRFRPVLQALPPNGDPPTTPREGDIPDRTVVLPETVRGNTERRYELGPAEMTGSAIRTARAEFDTQGGAGWRVSFETTGSGSDQLATLSQKYIGKQVAIVLDGVVKSAPTFQQQISGSGEITGDFSEQEAKDLALVLRFGALPVQLEPETVEQVSATLGEDSLRAGIIAGVIGLGAVLLYMVIYYRLLGLVAAVGLALSAAIMLSIVSLLGETSGLALSLSGVVGIIVSVGVTIDSYIVYFERLKDEVRSGKTIRSSVDRGFARAWRTILAANLVSFIGAALLYWLTVGPVRGFAFFLGLSTVIDVLVAWFFTRPAVILVGRNRAFTEARWLGVARGLAATQGTPA